MNRRKSKKKRNNKRVKPLQKVALQGKHLKIVENKRQNVVHQTVKTKKMMMTQMKKVLKAAWTLLLKERVTLLLKPGSDQTTRTN